ncbi:MAG TPA: hypothetical protein VK843_04490 [Planctomycetota bacterium]|nr:hypothetical protein [Planctomycetota bacterium]
MARTFRNFLLILVGLTIAWLGIRGIYRALASAETKIRWRIEEMVEGFNARRAQPVLDGLAKDFVDRTSGLTRDEFHSILTWTYFNELDDKGLFLWSASFDPKELAIELAPDEQSAAVECHLLLYRRRGDEKLLDWDAHLGGKLVLGEDGWQWSVLTTANHAQRSRR